MSAGETAAARRLRVAAGVYVAIRKKRTTMQARARQQLEQQMLAGQQQALHAAIVMSAAAAQDKAPRRTVKRAAGSWRGSTIAGYLQGDDTTYLQNFRSSKYRFNDLVSLLGGSVLDKASVRADYELRGRAARFKKAHEIRDTPDLRYKVAACMYALGQGGSIKVLADVASIGVSTLTKYLHLFAEATVANIKPIYMPGRPFSAEDRAAVQGQFASRRGLDPVTLACDGSHVPFKPKNKKVAT